MLIHYIYSRLLATGVCFYLLSGNKKIVGYFFDSIKSSTVIFTSCTDDTEMFHTDLKCPFSAC